MVTGDKYVSIPVLGRSSSYIYMFKYSDTGITMPTVLDVTFVKSVIIPSGIEVTIQPYMILMLFCCLIIGAAMIRKFKKKF